MNGDLKSIPRDVQVGSADRVRVERGVRPGGGLVTELFRSQQSLGSDDA